MAKRSVGWMLLVNDPSGFQPLPRIVDRFKHTDVETFFEQATVE
jgi:hypothetical protein